MTWLKPSALTIDNLRRSDMNDSLYLKNYRDSIINFKTPVLISNKSNKQVTKKSKEVIFFYSDDKDDGNNHIIVKEDSYFDNKENHIKTHMYDIHFSGIMTNGNPVKLGLSKDIMEKELNNKDIRNFTYIHNIKNEKNFIFFNKRVNNMEILNSYDREYGQKCKAHNIKLYNYNTYKTTNKN